MKYESLTHGIEPNHIRKALNDAYTCGLNERDNPTETIMKRFIQDDECEACQ